MNRSLIIALDFATLIEVETFLKPFKGEKLFVKVGMELFYQSGPKIIHYLKEQDHQIFLDLKLHDIPNTVRSAMKGLARLEVDLVNVHAAGGHEMMSAALEGLDEGTISGRKRPQCIAVTQLTSTSQGQMQREQLIDRTLEQSVLHYSLLAKKAGLDGVVCSAHEVSLINSHVTQPFHTITPGIRHRNDQVHDQKRVMTPEQACAIGATSIVVGRSITKATHPFERYQEMKKAWEAGIIETKNS